MAEDIVKTVVRADSSVATGSVVTVVVMPAWKMVLVRAARVYLQSLLGFLTANASGLAELAGVPIDKFGNAFYVAATLAVAPAVVSVIQNVIEILSNIDVNRPGLRA